MGSNFTVILASSHYFKIEKEYEKKRRCQYITFRITLTYNNPNISIEKSALKQCLSKIFECL